ncbi:glycosyltransferase [uncultured Cellulomonas sp.]|uniref:glycosyltransferase family 2 protein n=1 Tax=uncultured Cellulomonas sp. TaxID=189682 RepID=UPI002610AC6B|nr:glycosyltransferase [uncultured Cellulomonas sp.]
MSYLPVVTVLTVVSAPASLHRTFASLESQTSRRWQWVVAVAPGTAPATAAEVDEIAARDPRVSPVRSAGTTDAEHLAAALAQARGTYVAVVEPGDMLAQDALEVVADAASPDSWVYTDEGTVAPDGGLLEAWLKPGYSPELLRSQPYAVALAVLPTAAVHDVGGVDPSTGSAGWYDLVLRVSERSGAPAHVPGTYYHRDARAWPAEPPYVVGAAADRCRVVAEHCARVGIDAVSVSPVEVDGRPVGQRVVRRSRGERVSVVVPTRGGASVVHGFTRVHVVELVRGLWAADRYPDLELVVVHDAETPAPVLAEIEQITGGDWVSVPFQGEFDFSRKCNLGAAAATGEVLCFLNDDTQVRSAGWLHELTSLLDADDVGLVGARLLFADGTLQHAGVYAHEGIPTHVLFRAAADTLELGGLAQLTGERLAVTAACQVVRADTFRRLGGFSPALPLNFNDVDLCLKARAAGLRNLYTPYATLDHYESQTRVPTVTDREVATLRRRWSVGLDEDPYVNPLARRPPPAGGA